MDANFHIAFEDKNARVFIVSPKPRSRPFKRVSPRRQEVSTLRMRAGLNDLLANEETLAAVIKGDPEIDLDTIGTIVDETTRAYYDPKKKEIAHDFNIITVAYNPDGTERERKPFQKRKVNVNDTNFPVKVGKLATRSKVLDSFVIARAYQLCHDDGVKYEFLYNLAKTLEEKDAIALLGAGPNGNAPLIFKENGRPYRCGLAGKTDGESYLLTLLLFGQELKKPKPPEA